MKRVVFFIIGIIFLFITGYMLLFLQEKKKDTSKLDVTKKNNEMTGYVEQIVQNTVTVRNEKGAVYTFFIPSDYNFKLGDVVHLLYTGTLDTAKSLQTVTVEEIKVMQKKEDTYPASWNDQGLFQKYYKEAYQKLKTMTLREKLNQLLLVRVPEEYQVDIAKQYQFGGYVLFGRDTKDQTKEQLMKTIEQYQSVSKIPMIIATDEEGGTVNRVSLNPKLVEQPFLSSKELYQKGGYDFIKEDTKKKSELLYSLGINMNLAPVADVSTDEADYMYRRSFGKNAKETAKYIETVIKASKEGKVAYTLKHFPGYGNNKDTHKGISIDNRSYESFMESDFLPFVSGIKEGVPTILVSHNIINAIEPDKPASLSKNIHNILRERLGFTGLVITDDLVMDAILKYVEKPIIEAIQAGNDMIIVTDYEQAIIDMNQGLEDNQITEEMVDHLVFRILAFKYYMSLM